LTFFFKEKILAILLQNKIMFSISHKEKIFFVEHLYLMIKAGFSITEALEVLIDEARSKRFKSILNDVLKRVTEDNNITWKLSIKAFAGEAKDTGNYLGVREDAKEEWDQYDQVEPPVIGDYVAVFFPHYDWKQYPYNYTVDFRPPSPGYIWDFNVSTNISRETVDMELYGTEQLPEGYYVSIIDLDNFRKINLENKSFSFISGKALIERHFRLLVNNSSQPETPTSAPEHFITAVC